MASKHKTTDVKVGIFVVAGIAATFAALFIVGQERRLWEKTADLRAQFANVGGLKVGAAARLAGVNVGIVSRIDLPKLDKDADERVVGPTKLHEIKVDSGAAPSPALMLPLKATKFASPMNLALIVQDPDEKLEAAIEVLGTDLHGNPAKERILVRLRGAEGVTVGKVYFSAVNSIELKVLKDHELTSDKNTPPILRVGDGTARKLNVILRVSENFLERIRTDSEASITGEGLLGDKYIDITLGSMSRPRANDGDLLMANDAVDITAALADAGEIIDNVNASAESVRVLLDGFRKAGGEATIVAAAQSIQDIAKEIQGGDGLIHQLIFDSKSGAHYKDIVGTVASSTKKLDDGLGQLDQILKDVRTNKSLVNELLYGDGGEAVVQDAQKLIGEATQIASDIRTKEGFVHNLIYQPDSGEIMANAGAASADVKAITADVKSIVADVKRGKGSLGGFINDPSVYEDLKLLLGNVRRNDAVKSIVRYAIEQEEKKGAKPPTTK